MRFRRKKREKVDITLISMIDVLFVLLLFFMVSTTFNRHTKLNINLPEAKGSDAEDKQDKSVTVEIDKKGFYNVIASNGQSRLLQNHSRESLERELAKLAPEEKALPFIIRADGDAPTKAVITVLDVAGQEGFKNISFPTEEPKSETEE